jgi:hypothetical protein
MKYESKIQVWNFYFQNLGLVGFFLITGNFCNKPQIENPAVPYKMQPQKHMIQLNFYAQNE